MSALSLMNCGAGGLSVLESGDSGCTGSPWHAAQWPRYIVAPASSVASSAFRGFAAFGAFRSTLASIARPAISVSICDGGTSARIETRPVSATNSTTHIPTNIVRNTPQMNPFILPPLTVPFDAREFTPDASRIDGNEARLLQTKRAAQRLHYAERREADEGW